MLNIFWKWCIVQILDIVTNEKRAMMENKKSPSNIYDVAIVIINAIFNLLKVEKIVCAIILYLIYRDNYLVHKLNENTDISKLLIDVKVLEHIFNNDNILITCMGVIIVCLLFSLIVCIFVVRPIYIKEIDRLSAIRRELMHGKEIGATRELQEHHSSKKN